MENLFNIINVGYTNNSYIVKVFFKKKYIVILEKLLKLNCINGYSINKGIIIIKLRYFQNKPLIFFLMKSKKGNKIYKKFYSNNSYIYKTSLSLFYTNKGLLTEDEIFFKGIGGEYVVDILLLNKT